MQEQLSNLFNRLKENSAIFNDVIQFIENYYKHEPTAFKNGGVYNTALQNQGSAKVFAFAQINNLSEQDTLYLFAEHYQSVLASPDATDHQNIKQFMAHGWPGIVFEGKALSRKNKFYKTPV